MCRENLRRVDLAKRLKRFTSGPNQYMWKAKIGDLLDYEEALKAIDGMMMKLEPLEEGEPKLAVKEKSDLCRKTNSYANLLENRGQEYNG